MDEATTGRRKTVVATLAVLIMITVIVTAIAAAPKKRALSASALSTPRASNAAAADVTYKDGSYTATGAYQSPGGYEEITISVTLKHNVITQTSATSGAKDSDAREYQHDFIAGYRSLIIGRDIGSVSLDRVSGASLTPQGFNDAIDQIRSQAQS